MIVNHPKLLIQERPRPPSASNSPAATMRRSRSMVYSNSSGSGSGSGSGNDFRNGSLDSGDIFTRRLVRMELSTSNNGSLLDQYRRPKTAIYSRNSSNEVANWKEKLQMFRQLEQQQQQELQKQDQPDGMMMMMMDSAAKQNLDAIVTMSRCNDLAAVVADVKLTLRTCLTCNEVEIFAVDVNRIPEANMPPGGVRERISNRAANIIRKYAILIDLLPKESPLIANDISNDILSWNVTTPEGVAVAVIKAFRKIGGASWNMFDREVMQSTCVQLGVIMHFHCQMLLTERSMNVQRQLKEASVAVFGEADPKVIVNRVGHLAAKLTESATARVWMFNRANNTCWTIKRSRKELVYEEKPMEGVARLVANITDGSAINVSDTRSDFRMQGLRRHHQANRNKGSKKYSDAEDDVLSDDNSTVVQTEMEKEGLPPSLLAVPIVSIKLGETVGTVVCRDKRNGTFSKDDEDNLKELASMFYDAFQNAEKVVSGGPACDNSFDVSLNIADIESALISKACQLIGGKITATLFLFDDQHDRLVYKHGPSPLYLSLDSYPVGECFMMRAPIVIQNASKDPRLVSELHRPDMAVAKDVMYKYACSVLCMPIQLPKNAGNVDPALVPGYGVLQLTSMSAMGLGKDDETRLRPLCFRAAMSILNSSKLETTQRSQSALLRLVEMTASIAEAESVEEVVNMISERGKGAFDIGDCLLWLRHSSKEEVWTLSKSKAASRVLDRRSSSAVGGNKKQASNQFEQILMTMPISSGIIGEVFRTAKPTVLKQPLSGMLQHELQSLCCYSSDEQIDFVALWPILKTEKGDNKENPKVEGIIVLVNNVSGILSREDKDALHHLSGQLLGCLAKFERIQQADKRLQLKQKTMATMHHLLDELLPCVMSEKMDHSLVQKVEKITAELTHSKRCDVIKVDWDRNQLLWQDAERPDVFMKFWHMSGITGSVAKTGKTEVIANLQEDERYDAAVDAWHEGIKTRCLMVVPVKDMNDAVVALLQIHNKSDGEFSDEDVSVAQRSAQLYGITLSRQSVMERYRAFGPTLCEIHEDLEKAEMLKRVVGVVASVLDAREVKLYLCSATNSTAHSPPTQMAPLKDAASVPCLKLATMVVNPASGSLLTPAVTAPPKVDGDEVVQEAARLRVTVNTSTYATRSRRCVAVPVIDSSGNLRAVIQASEKRNGGGFDEGDTVVIKSVANQCSIASINCGRFELLNESRRKLLGLFKGISALYECRNTETLVITISKIVKQVMGCEAVSAFLTDPQNRNRIREQFDDEGQILSGSEKASEYNLLKSKLVMEVLRTSAPTGSVWVESEMIELPLSHPRRLALDSGMTTSQEENRETLACFACPLHHTDKGFDGGSIIGVLVLIRNRSIGLLDEEDENVMHVLCEITSQLIIKAQRQAQELAKRWVLKSALPNEGGPTSPKGRTSKLLASATKNSTPQE